MRNLLVRLIVFLPYPLRRASLPVLQQRTVNFTMRSLGFSADIADRLEARVVGDCRTDSRPAPPHQAERGRNGVLARHRVGAGTDVSNHQSEALHRPSVPACSWRRYRQPRSRPAWPARGTARASAFQRVPRPVAARPGHGYGSCRFVWQRVGGPLLALIQRELVRRGGVVIVRAGLRHGGQLERQRPPPAGARDVVIQLDFGGVIGISISEGRRPSPSCCLRWGRKRAGSVDRSES